MTIDYRSMKVGDRAPMPVPNAWEGTNQNLYQEIQAYCQTIVPAPQFQVETISPRGEPRQFWLNRTR